MCKIPNCEMLFTCFYYITMYKATRSPEISRQHVRKPTQQMFLTPTLGMKNQNKGMEDIVDIDSHCPYLLSGATTFHLTYVKIPYLLFGETTSHLTS